MYIGTVIELGGREGEERERERGGEREGGREGIGEKKERKSPGETMCIHCIVYTVTYLQAARQP